MIRAGIFGATGYMGGEALRVLLDHPDVEIAFATSRGGGKLADFHPNLYGVDLDLVHPDDAGDCDVVFLAGPTPTSVEAAPRFLAAGARVIDLGAAFRLRDRATWERIYGMQHTQWELVEQAVYGIAELHERELRETRLVANPGCFSSAAILGLAPLVAEDLVDRSKLVVDGLSGTAGVGAEFARLAHHPELGDNLAPYNAIGHRHTFEMEQELGALASAPVPVHFSPTYVPIVRGILDVCHAFPDEGAPSRERLLELYRDFYASSPFVQVWDRPVLESDTWNYRPYPWVSAVNGSNGCHIGLDVDPERGRIVVFSVLDSIGKGGAHAGVENMNLMFGLERTAGLTGYGRHP